MRKKVALFANGWTTENLISYLESLRATLPDDFADIYSFISYESYGQPPKGRESQRMAYKLPDLSLFDAAIVFFPGLNFAESISYIYESIDKAGIPAISICNKRDGYYNIDVDNYSGMTELCNHVIEEHHCNSSIFIAGSKDNKDSNERLQATLDALKAHGCPEPEIFYSNWEAGSAKEYLQAKNYTAETLPNVVFCANDHLATFSILAFEELGFSAPKDFIITGFDNINRGKIFYPSIASVNQHFDKIGAVSSEMLYSMFNGGEISNAVIPCSFSPAESCGCSQRSNSDELRRKYTHNFPYMDQHDFLLKGRMFAIEEAFLQATDYASLKSNLHALYSKSSSAESNSFCMMVDPLFANIGKDFEYTPYKFCDEMDVIIAKHDSKEIILRTCETRQIIPPTDEYTGNQFHVISPVFHESYICGYFVITNSFSLLHDNQLYDYANRINRIIFSYKRNMQLSELNLKLSELMEQDSLTRVKNRTAYEKYLKRLERDFVEGENAPFAVIYFDINNLKMVNDMYGHEKGDAYIKNSCRLMCNTFKHSPVFRIGGDEFVTIAINDDYKNRHELLNQMREHMVKLKEKGETVPLTERISIASGMAEYDRTLDENFGSIFKRADEIMYENKYKMKQGS